MNKLQPADKIAFRAGRFEGRVFGIKDFSGNEFLVVTPKDLDRAQLKMIRVNLDQLDPAHIHTCEVITRPERVRALIEAAKQAIHEFDSCGDSDKPIRKLEEAVKVMESEDEN